MLVGIWDMVYRLPTKYMLIAGEEDTHACVKSQICGGMESGIDGGINVMGFMWDQ